MLGALGIGGIALAFAAQDILSSFVAGVLLQVQRRAGGERTPRAGPERVG